jgi:quercetin dioxygenase-like cupin family protein
MGETQMNAEHKESDALDNRPSGSIYELVEVQPDAVVSRTILKAQGGNLTVFAFDEGEGLSSHTTPHDAVLWLLEGEAVVNLREREYILGAGDYLLLPVDIPHAVQARTPMKMALALFFRSN